MDEETRREIIMANYMQPIGKKETPEDTSNYKLVNSKNDSCIDNLNIYVDIKDDTIKDIFFNGEACAISTSSTSIMINELIGKTTKEAIEFINNFENMINEKTYNKDILGEALAYEEIYKQGNRKHCANLPYIGIKKVIEEYKETNN